MKRATGRGSDQFNLRFPEGMRDELRQAAEMSGRSMNMEIIHRLQESISDIRSDILKLDLPADVWNMLMVDAGMNSKSMAERAIEILQNTYDLPTEYNQSIRYTGETVSRNAELEDLIAEKENQVEQEAQRRYDAIDRFFTRIDGLEKEIQKLRSTIESSDRNKNDSED